jgi:hypothetical protein
MSREVGAINAVKVVQAVGTVHHRQNFHQGLFFCSMVAGGVCGSFPPHNMSPPSSTLMAR